MSALIDESVKVPIAGGQDVDIKPGQPWPAPYRGSRYSLIESRDKGQRVFQWRYNDLVIHVEPPRGLIDQLQMLGKSSGSGKGSIRITANGEILTKIQSSEYANSGMAPVDSGWIPVYLGQLDGQLGFEVETDPEPPNETVDIWGGLPFNHGETWSVSADERLIWKWKDYRFYSAFEHSELVEAYERYRTRAGRLYINEFGHVIVNVPRGEIPTGREEEVNHVFGEWKRQAERNGNSAALKLVTRRLKVTGDGNPEEGHLPVHIGHLDQFDGGVIPKPVVDDESYYVAAARGEELNPH